MKRKLGAQMKLLQCVNDGEKLESIEVKFKLSSMKPLHAKWLMEACDHMTTATSREINLNGWVKNGINRATENGSTDIPTLDPFLEIDSIENQMWQDLVVSIDGSIKTTYITDNLESDSNSEWEDDGGNIFDVFNIKDEEWLY